MVEEIETKWTTVRILSKLAVEIESALPNTSLPNMTRFVDDAVRNKLREVKDGLPTDRGDNISTDQEAQPEIKVSEGSGLGNPVAQ